MTRTANSQQERARWRSRGLAGENMGEQERIKGDESVWQLFRQAGNSEHTMCAPTIMGMIHAVVGIQREKRTSATLKTDFAN